VTPEYNHSVPAALKNAFDVLYPEWSDKPAAFVGYGADGAVRAIEHWRSIVANARMVAVRAQVSLSLFHDLGEDGLAPMDRREDELSTVFDQVEQMAGALAPLRAA
jgi:NAD(P)H-dependent FMN reductase